MALRFSEGFDSYTSTSDFSLMGWENDDPTNNTLDNTGSTYGGKCLLLGSTTASTSTGFTGIARPLMSRISGSLVRIAFRMRTKTSQSFAAGLSGGEALLQIHAGHFGFSTTGWNLTLMIDSTNCVTIYKYDQTISNTRDLIGTGTIPVNNGSWHHIEVEFVEDTTAGSAKVWVDGTLDINVSGIDTRDSVYPLSWLNTVKLGSGKATPVSGDFIKFDDVIIWDDDTTDPENSMAGELPNHTHRIITRFPKSDQFTEFTPSTGASNEPNVDEFSDGDTTYNSSTGDHRDTFTMENVIAYAEIMMAVKAVAYARNATGGGAPKLKSAARRSSSTNTSESIPVVRTVYSPIETVLSRDPVLDATWLHNQLTATRFGYERVS